MLPKIHKRLENVPGRPVISNCGTAAEEVSEFLDCLIQPLVEQIPSIIRDSTHLLQRLESLGHIPSTAILCNMDVVGLYPHIPHEGLEALKKASDKSDAELPVDDLVSLAKVVLENNFFEFDEKLFRQKLGIRLLELSSLRAILIFLWVILRRNFWIVVNLGPGYGGDF